MVHYVVPGFVRNTLAGGGRFLSCRCLRASRLAIAFLVPGFRRRGKRHRKGVFGGLARGPLGIQDLYCWLGRLLFRRVVGGLVLFAGPLVGGRKDKL